MLKNNLSVKVFDDVATKYTKVYFDDMEDATWIDKLLELLPQNSKILDVGCGPGNYTNYVASKGFGVMGVDLSKNMIRIAKKKVPHAEFQIMDMRRLEIESNSYDGVMSLYSLVFIPQKEVSKTLKEFHRILKPHGAILIVAHKGKSDHYIRYEFNKGERLFINLFTVGKLKKLLENAGFDVVTITEQDPPPESTYVGKKIIYALAKSRKKTTL